MMPDLARLSPAFHGIILNTLVPVTEGIWFAWRTINDRGRNGMFWTHSGSHIIVVTDPTWNTDFADVVAQSRIGPTPSVEAHRDRYLLMVMRAPDRVGEWHSCAHDDFSAVRVCAVAFITTGIFCSERDI